MKFRRRVVIQSLAGGVAAAVLPGSGSLRAQSPSTTTLVVILLDRNATADARARTAALDAFTEAGIPVGLASADPTPFAARMAAEPLLWSPDAIEQTRYFQARTLSPARAALASGLEDPRAPWILAAPDPGGALSLAGLSPPGLRHAYLVPQQPTPGWVETHPARVTAARGGHLAQIGPNAADAALAFLTEASWDPAQVHATLFVDLQGPAEAVTNLARTIATAAATRIEAGNVVPLAPSELAVRHTGQYQRLIALRLDPPQGAPPDEPALAALSEALTDAGIAFSVARDTPDTLRPKDVLRLDGTNLHAAKASLDAARGWLCATVSPANPAAAALLAPAGIAAATGAAAPEFRGIDGHGLTHLGPVHPVQSARDIDALAAGLALAEDPILAVETDAFAQPALRNALTVALRRLSQTAGTRIVDMANYTTLIRAADPVIETMRATRAAAPAIAAHPSAAPPYAARAELTADARRAWAYFEATTDPDTGLPATTVAFTPEGKPATQHKEMTQWDAGSAIFANIAAHNLGLVTPEAFANWRLTLLASLSAATLPEPHLPRAVFNVAAPWRGNRDFNICDTARLLSALSALDRLDPDGDDEVRALVETWDFGAVVKDGIAHSIERGALVLVNGTHCTNYIKRAFARWGYSVASLYDVQGETEADMTMRLLTEVSDIGPLGAEPLLLEALELGLDRPSTILRDVLLTAQIAETAATGKLFAPSEGPMERPPWFTYQGLRVDHTGPKRWDVISLDPGGDSHPASFREAVWMISSKAAFLWAATHPHPYSDRLLAYVRAHARLPTGFASGVYTSTNAPTPGYADANTNGIILAAIASMLGSPA